MDTTILKCVLFGSLVLVCQLVCVCSVSPAPRPAGRPSNMSDRGRSFHLVLTTDGSTLNEKQLQQIQAPTTTVYLPVLYLVAFIVGLPSNLLALWVLVFRTSPLPSTLLLINLTVTDCLLLLVLPFRIAYHFAGNHWQLGEPLCRVVMATFYGNMYGSVWCLALVALDRYVALVHPFSAKSSRGRHTSLLMTASVWVVVLSAMLPLLVSQQTYTLDTLNITTCHDALPPDAQTRFLLPYFGTLFAACFLLPLAVIVFCHGAVLRTLLAEGKRYGHAVRVTVLVLLVFLVCVLPSNILLLVSYTSFLQPGGDDVYVAYMLSLAVSTFNSCIDPFIFYYVSAEFREKAADVLFHCGGSGDRPASTATNTSYCSSTSGPRAKTTLLSMSSQHGTSRDQVSGPQPAQ